MTQPLRIAYRGNFTRPFCTEVHVAASLEALGHTVVRLQENQTTWAQCVDAAKQSHMFLWTKTWIIEPEQGHAALAEMHDAGVPTVSFHLDRYVGLDREAQIVDDPFWRTQFVFTADGGSDEAFAAYGVNHFWMPPGMYDAEAHIGQPNPRRFPHPIVFVGSYPYPHSEWADYRRDLIETVRGRFGSDFHVWPEKRQPLRNKDLSDLYASAQVVIGDSCLSRGATHYWSDRVPETLGRGGYLIHPEVEGMDGWYRDGHDLHTYKLGDFGRVIELCEWALANPADRRIVAEQGQRTVLARDTYKHRMQTVLDTVAARAGFHAPETRVVRTTTRHRSVPQSTSFHVRDGHPTDAQVVAEVWKSDQYAITAADVRGKTVVDVGANIGAFSVLAAKLGARAVHAYEPEPGNADLLRKNTAGMPVHVHETALGGEYSHASLRRGPSGVHGGGTHLGPLEDGVSECAVVPADEVLGALGPIGFLKLDCEGSEYAIVQALSDATLSNIERMAGEWHGPLMPHLADFWPRSGVGDFMTQWSLFVAKLADHGRLTLHGHPRAGGVFRWRRF